MPGDVLDLVQRKHSSATSAAKRQAWATLESLITAERISQSKQENLNHTWRIRRIAITGFRGAGPDPDVPLVINLPPCPGLTVFHGENGSGKSTVAHALTAALHPEYRSEPRDKRIKMADDPWDSCDVHVDAQSAKVEVTLVADNGERIDATTSIDATDGTAARSIISRGEDLGPAWDEVYTIHRPVFAYAGERRGIKGADALRSFLLGHLLIGGYLDSLRATTKPRLEAATKAHADMDHAWDGFVSALTAISARHPGAPGDAGSVARPADDETREAWLTAHALTGEQATQAPPLLHRTDVERARTAVGAARSAVATYRAAASAAWGPLDFALHTFAAEAESCSSVPDDECPCAAVTPTGGPR
ncbi:MAG: AAA family ATPase [Actinophytocola sp.]|nr:AAA family ATPase [Actinophytocola sp.]